MIHDYMSDASHVLEHIVLSTYCILPTGRWLQTLIMFGGCFVSG